MEYQSKLLTITPQTLSAQIAIRTLVALHDIVRVYNQKRGRIHVEMPVASIRREKKRKLDRLKLDNNSDVDRPSPPSGYASPV